jgi:hypothetical protein
MKDNSLRTKFDDQVQQIQRFVMAKFTIILALMLAIGASNGILYLVGVIDLKDKFDM